MIEACVYFTLEFCLQFFNEIFRISRNVAALGNVVPDDAVDIFDLAFFPGMIRVAKVDRDAKYLFQFFMMGKQQIVIRGHGFPFRVSFLNPQASAGYRF